MSALWGFTEINLSFLVLFFSDVFMLILRTLLQLLSYIVFLVCIMKKL